MSDEDGKAVMSMHRVMKFINGMQLKESDKPMALQTGLFYKDMDSSVKIA